MSALMTRIAVATLAIEQIPIWSRFDAVTLAAAVLTFVVVILLQCDAPIRVSKSRTMAVQQEIKHRGNRARHASVPYSLYF
jgi:hypothetical protein